MKGESETTLLHRMMLRFTELGARVFRNQSGVAYQGHAIRIKEEGQIGVRKGDVLIRDARMFHCGLVKGASELIGWHSVTIPAEWVGRTIAVFVACEGKVGRNEPTAEQKQFVEQVIVAGGIGLICWKDDAVDWLSAWEPFKAR